MKIKILIVSKYTWPTRLKKHEQIKALMMTGGFENITFDTIKRDVGKPDIENERITEAWFEKNISKDAKGLGYDFCIFQFSKADGYRWGIESRVHGLNFRDGDFFGEAWVCCDEDSEWRFNVGPTWNEYCKSIPHEIGHELTRQGYTKLEVHDFDYKRDINNLPEFYVRMAKENNTILGGLLLKLAELQKLLFFKKQEITDMRPLVKRKAEELMIGMNARALPVRITQGFRSVDEQNRLYAQGRTTHGAIVTNAKGGESFHSYGVAFDVVFVKKGYNATEEEWRILGELGESLGFEWGGSEKWIKAGFIDKPHFQMTLGYTLKDFQTGNVDYTKYN